MKKPWNSVERIDSLRERAKRKRGVNIALVSLYDIENNAVRLLAGNLRQHLFPTIEIYFKDWINNYISPPTSKELKNFIDLLDEKGVDMVGLSLRCSSYLKIACILTEMVHSELGIPVIWGGVHPTVCPQESLEYADMLLRGEADLCLIELAEKLRDGDEIFDIKNLDIRYGDRIFRNPLRPLIQNLDTIPFRDYTSDGKYWIIGNKIIKGDPMIRDPVFQIMASRGCIFRCAFCYNSIYRKRIYPGLRYYRCRSVENVMKEIEEGRKSFRNMRKVKFDDEIFNTQKNWFDEFLISYPERVGLPFEVFLEPQVITEERIRKLKEAGLDVVYMGIQNSRRVNEELYNRKSGRMDLKGFAKIFKKYGVDIRYQLIFDDPVATEEDYRELFEMILDFPLPYQLYLFSMTIFPETGLAEKLLKEKIITPDDIEGRAIKTFYQHRVDLAFPRDPSVTFWLSLFVLLSKEFIPRPLLKILSNSHFLRKNPAPLTYFAQTVNLMKWSNILMKMIMKGELSITLIRRWLRFDSLITQ